MITEKRPLTPSALAPYDHQRDDFLKSRSWEYYGLLWEMGTGKSKPLIDTFCWLYCQQEIDGVLILSDKGCYLNWPIHELPKHMAPDIECRMAIWSSYQTKAVRQKLDRVLCPRDDVLDIVVMNIEALSGPRGEAYARAFVECHHAMMIIDESTSIKNTKSRRTKAALRIGARAEYRRIATGTPITQGPLDLYAQCEFLRPGLLGHRTFTSFRAHYAIMQRMRIGRQEFMQVVGYRNLEDLQARIRQFTSRLTKEECLDLPDKVYERCPVPLTEAQAVAYDKIRREAVLQLEQGLLTCESALTVVEKLHQICLGHVKLDDDTVVHLDHERCRALVRQLEILGDRKVVIWCHYQVDVENVMRAISEISQRRKFAVDYYGKTSDSDRVHNLRMFTTNPDCLWLVGSGRVGGKGLTLVVSSYVIYYSYDYKLETRMQSEDRVHRIGQADRVTYLDMYAPSTVEVEILAALREKRDLARAVLDQDYLRKVLSSPEEQELPG